MSSASPASSLERLLTILPKKKRRRRDEDEIERKTASSSSIHSQTQLNPSHQKPAAHGDSDVQDHQPHPPDDTDDHSEAQWVAPAYDAHYAAEWSADSIEQSRAALEPRDISLPGLGDARLAAARDTTLPSAATLASSDDETWMRSVGVLPPLRAKWHELPHSADVPRPLPAAGRSLYAMLAGYVDVLHPSVALESFASSGLLAALALHAAQHVLVATRTQMRHSKKGLETPDRGFTRPTVLVVLPFRSHANDFLRTLLALLPSNIEQVDNRTRFEHEFAEEEGAAQLPAAKPEDYRLLFRGNTDDCFRIGVRLLRKSAKMYASFYTADLIVASPLGLRLGLGEEGEKEADSDWLSSIEVLLALHADVFLMQNWTHVSRLLELINRIPKQTRDIDFARVRPYVLDGLAGALRQTAVLASHAEPEMRALVQRQCANCRGRVQLLPTYGGQLSAVPRGTQQLFLRFDASSPQAVAEERLDFFRASLLPRLVRSLHSASGSQPILFVPSYFDFVRVRTLLADESVAFAAISEYTEPTEVARVRTALRKGILGAILVYTERAHFFRRHLLRGAHHLAFYALPSYERFYGELAQMLEQGGKPTCATAFCRFDVERLRRLVGDVRTAQMLEGADTSFAFQ